MGCLILVGFIKIQLILHLKKGFNELYYELMTKKFWKSKMPINKLSEMPQDVSYYNLIGILKDFITLIC